MKKFVIFEDERVDNFNPLVYFRPVYELRCGVFTLREKAERAFGVTFDLHARKFLEAVLREEFHGRMINEFAADEIVFVNGRAVFDEQTAQEIFGTEEETLFVADDVIVAAKLNKGNYEKVVEYGHVLDFSSFADKFPVKKIEAKVFNYVWDLIYANGEEIVKDSKYFEGQGEWIYENYRNVGYIGFEKIYVGKNVAIYPNVVIDASHGPVVIDDGVTVMSQSVIQGPAYIGKNSIVKIGAKIYHETTVGEVCKVGGEIENAIFQSYSNKQHDGFLGHAYLGRWVNLGAATNNSDLKNNYAKISVKHNGRVVDTGLQFLGLIMGDHSKTAIGTLFNTGTIVGVSSNIFGAGFQPRAIPSFAWGGSEFIKEYKLEKALEVAEIVMSRRNKKLTDAMKTLFSDVFKFTEHERKRLK
jgi:UDP-N-acetylglucosamine diphosphorylase/glucosamine-1-phosphate N-acetyltransferase